jgi:hypothetical protein
MTSIAHHAVLIASSSGAVTNAYVNAILALSPVGFWKLNEISGTAAVATAGGINGVYAGTSLALGQPSITPTDPGMVCVRLTNTPTNSTSPASGTPWGHVSVGTSTDFRPASNFTWTCIVKLDSVISGISSGQTFISHGGSGVCIRHSATTSGQVEVLKSQAASRLTYAAGLAAGTPYHVAIRVTSAGVLTLHINGVLVATGTTASDYGAPVRALRFGVDAQIVSDTLQGPYAGSISCPALFTSLTDAQILGLAQAAGLA